ncbi:hypothetical protein SFRURICE_000130 [Spodoptera frugiperda]|nr:hypothetical protein SFRURICE_000130 [Spodoptera frugiperda]
MQWLGNWLPRNGLRVQFPHQATLFIIHKLYDVYVNLYVYKRTHNVEENPKKGQTEPINNLIK